MNNPITAALQALSGLAGKANQPERREPGPGDVGPSVDTKADVPTGDKKASLVSLDMTEDEVGEWWMRIEAARDRVKAREEKWDILLNEYLPIVEKSGSAESVKVNRHFRDVHSKLGQLFYQTPDLTLEPDDPGPGNDTMPNPMNAMQPPPVPGGPPPQQFPPLKREDIVSIKQAVLNKKMGRDGLKAARLMDELLFDILAWTPFAVCKVGYRCVFKPIPAPPQQPGAILNIAGPSSAPPTEPVPIFEEYYARRVSPKKALFNADLFSTRFEEDATWVAMEFYMAPKVAMRVFGLTEDEANKAAEDDRRHLFDEDKPSGAATQLVHGVEVWCKLSYFTDQPHPQAIGQLVLIEGIKDRPIVWRASPDQTFGPDGKLTEDSVVGFPIKFLTIRDLADSPFPPSDAAFQNSGIKQMSTWSRQSVRLRDAAVAKILYDQGAFDKEEINVLQNAELGTYVAVMDGKLAQGADKIIAPAYQVHSTPDDYRGRELMSRDLDENLGIGANQSGATTDTVRTATETNTVNRAIMARNEKERSRVVDFYLDVARTIDQLLMRYADDYEYVHIVGQDGARQLQAWNKNVISGRYLYDIAPDSQLSVDASSDFDQDLQLYNQTAKDPLANRAYLLKRMARHRRLDPSKFVNDPNKIAQPKPIPPSISFNFKGPDLSDPTVQEILLRAEVLPPPTPATPPAGGPVSKTQPPHGGHNSGGEVVSQHSAANSGGMPNAPGADNHRETQVK